MSSADLQRTGFASGLTALLAELAIADFAEDLRPYLDDQRRQVAPLRVERFQPIIFRVLAALAAVDVPATPVKGAELVNGIWEWPSARPMSDVDVIVPPQLRAQAAAALVAEGFVFDGASTHEDTFLAWGDGSVGRTDGESVDHNGRIEIHPGLGEFIHGYVVGGLSLESHTSHRELGGVECARLDLDGVTASVVAHLSSTVVRGEVRPINVVDVWFCDAAGADWQSVVALLDECDPRLSGPGLWLTSRLLPGVVPSHHVDRQLDRLPEPARRRLTGAEPSAVLRDPNVANHARLEAGIHRARRRTRCGASTDGAIETRSPVSALRVAVVMPPVTDLDRDSALELWPTFTKTLEALLATGEIEPIGCCRSSDDAGAVTLNGVEYFFESSNSRLARARGRVAPEHRARARAGFHAIDDRVRRAVGGRVPILAQHHGEPPATAMRSRIGHWLTTWRCRWLPVHRRRRAGGAVPTRRRDQQICAGARSARVREPPRCRMVERGTDAQRPPKHSLGRSVDPVEGSIVRGARPRRCTRSWERCRTAHVGHRPHDGARRAS